MAKHKGASTPHQSNTLHPGSSQADARKVGGKGDFGARESDVVERQYVSNRTKHADPGAMPERASAAGTRTSGVGGNASGPGSSSGGDLDPDVIGIGDGAGVAASGKMHEPAGPDDATETSRDFASGPLAQTAKRVPPLPPPGSLVQPPDDRTIAPQGADAASRSDPDDDSFVGEVSSDEATGRNDAGD